MLKNITVCLYTSTKGHFGRKDIYQTTVNSLLTSVSSPMWGGLLASVKYDEKTRDQGIEIGRWLVDRGFHISAAPGEWSHGNASHQIGYLNDQARLNRFVNTQYTLHMEDDWDIRAYDGSVSYWIERAVEMLSKDPSITQVRIPRYTNEHDRILGLMAKHQIQGKSVKIDKNHFRSNDWSNNPYISRTRDIRAALTMINVANLPKHSEHGMGKAMELLGWHEVPFVFFDPEKIRCGHLGCPVGNEDNLNAPLIAD